jgi:hypothetical protein
LLVNSAGNFAKADEGPLKVRFFEAFVWEPENVEVALSRLMLRIHISSRKDEKKTSLSHLFALQTLQLHVLAEAVQSLLHQ